MAYSGSTAPARGFVPSLLGVRSRGVAANVCYRSPLFPFEVWSELKRSCLKRKSLEGKTLTILRRVFLVYQRPGRI